MPQSRRAKLRAIFSGINLLFILFCLVVAAAGVIAINDLCLYTPDSTRYLVWAKSLASFDNYSDATLPDPVRYVVHAPFYPVLLSPVARAFPYNVIAAKYLTLAFGIIGLAFLYRWLLRRVGKLAALFAAFLLALNPLYFLYSTEVLSDIPFAATLLAFFLLMEKISEEPPVKLRYGIALAMVVAAGVLLREIGFSILVSAILFLLMKKRWKETVMVLILPVALYAIWYERNEIVVAAIENPSLTNAKLFTHHFFSLPGDSLFQELIARIWNNISVYGKGIGKLLFFPFYSWLQYDVVFINKAPLAQAYSLLDVIKYPLMLFTLSLSGYGVYADIKSSSMAMLRISFLLFYIIIVLLYPVNDIRFVIPMLILMIYYVSISLGNISWKALTPVIFLCMVPNLVWDYQFIENCHAYNQSSVNFYSSTIGLKKYPSHFTKPFRLVGEWLQAHTGQTSVFISQWKDLVCWVDERKVYPVDQTIPLDEFEHIIRDYEVTHLVTMVQKNGIREFEFQLHQSHRYEFVPVQRIANLEILEIRRKMIPLPSQDTSSAFKKGITLLNQQRYAEAEQVLDEARKNDSLNLPLLFYSSVVKEFGMKPDEASRQFASIGALPQSLMYLEESALHQQMISSLKNIERLPSKAERADQLYKIGGQCWNLGYRSQAESFIQKSIEQDSSFLPAMFLGIHIALQQGDTAEAKQYFASVRRARADHPAVQAFGRLFAQMDSLRKLYSRRERAAQYLVISRTYLSIGIVEAAIDNALRALDEDSKNIDALSLLADIYRSKRRYSPEASMLRQATSVDPTSVKLFEQLQQVMKHF